MSLLALMFSDSAYVFTLLDETYFTGSWVDAGWLISYVVWGTAALHPSMKELSKPAPEQTVRVSRGRLALLAVASLIAPAVRIVELLRGRDLEPFTTVIPTVILFALVMARLSGLVEMLTTALRRHEEAERERQRSEQRFGSLVQHASDVVTVVNENGQITFQSPSVMPVLGYERDVADRHAAERVDPRGRPRGRAGAAVRGWADPRGDAGFGHVPLAPPRTAAGATRRPRSPTCWTTPPSAASS